jgi:pyrimidine-nucleoside phosphorylase/thymidine phosphorylase
MGPDDLREISLELAARMIYLGRIDKTLDEARRRAEHLLISGDGYGKFKEVIAAQGGNPKVLDQFELLPNATDVREVPSPRTGYISSIDAELIGRASTMIGAGRDTKEDNVDPAVGIILEGKIGQRIEAGSVLCRIYITQNTNPDRLEEAAELIEDAFRISQQAPDSRNVILETVSV